MKNVYLKLTLSALLLPIIGQADEGALWKKDETKTQLIVKTTPFYEYHNRVVLFSPLHQAYERIKPNSIYWGLESWFMMVDNKHKNWLLDAEFRLGYNFFYNEVDHLTPFVGVGYIKDYYKRRHHYYHREGVTYATVGFLYDHEFGDVFNMGVHLKGLVGSPSGGSNSYWGSPVVGTDISVPITFRFGRHRHWDFRIEPFDTYLHGRYHNENYVGFRNTLGYRF